MFDGIRMANAIHGVGLNYVSLLYIIAIYKSMAYIFYVSLSSYRGGFSRNRTDATNSALGAGIWTFCLFVFI